MSENSPAATGPTHRSVEIGVVGATVVFAPALGSFLAPDLLGGGKKLLIGSLIQMQFTSSRNWPFGAALSTVVTVVVLTVFVIRSRKAQEARR